MSDASATKPIGTVPGLQSGAAPGAKAEIIPLEDIDKLLEADDPGFSASLEEVRSVEIDHNVEIETAIPDDELTSDDPANEKPARGFKAWLGRRRMAWMALRLRVRARLIQFFKDSVLWLKHRPKEYAAYAFVLLKAGLKQSKVPLAAFARAERPQKLLILVLLAMGVTIFALLVANLKGVWLPGLNQPLLHSMEEGADWVEEIDAEDAGESFYSAFPQERHEFLFGKMKVNLRRTPEHSNPMGAFEFIVQLDSKDTAIEVRDREVELSDLLQREFEDESFTDLESDLGKGRLKSRLKRALNQELTQGWVKDVSFKTFILKP